MKYISNAFSINMISEDGFFTVENITRDEFIAAGKDAYSIIGHPEIAENFGLVCNRESITLESGDELFVVNPSRRPAEGDANIKVYKFIPESEGYVYKKVCVL